MKTGEYPKIPSSNSRIDKSDVQFVEDLLLLKVHNGVQNSLDEFRTAVFMRLGGHGQKYLSLFFESGYKTRLYCLHARYHKGLSSEEFAAARGISKTAAYNAYLLVERKLTEYKTYIKNGPLVAPIMNMVGVKSVLLQLEDQECQDASLEGSNQPPSTPSRVAIGIDKPYHSSGGGEVGVSSQQLVAAWSTRKSIPTWRRKAVFEALELVGQLEAMPNPVSGPAPKNYSIQIVDGTGTPVLTLPFDPDASSIEEQLELMLKHFDEVKFNNCLSRFFTSQNDS